MKYRNKPCIVDDQRFASQAEAARYQQLRMLACAGAIQGARCQPRFPLVVNGQTVCTYVGDFYYREGDKECVEDVKGFETPVFKLKRKLFEALHPTIELRVIPAKSGRRSSKRSAVPRAATARRRNANSAGM